MASPLETIADLGRLSNLKNVSGRRRVRGEPNYLDELEEMPDSVAGTNDDQVLDYENPLPEATNASSYDVRANQIIEPEEENVFRKIGENLATSMDLQPDNAQRQAPAPPIETQQVDIEEGLPPVSAQQEEQALGQEPKGGFLESLRRFAAATRRPGEMIEEKVGRPIKEAVSDYFSPEKRKEMAASNERLLEDASLRTQGLDPEEARAQKHEEFQNQIDQALENPWEHAVYGATDEVARRPQLQQQFEEITGIDYTPQIEEEVKKYEEAMQATEEALRGEQTFLKGEQKRILDRILSNQTNEQDKLYIGMALLMPLIVGAVLGKEAGIGALGGAAQGIGQLLTQREKLNRADEEAVRDLSKQIGTTTEKLGNLEVEKLKLKPNLLKSLPKDEREHLKGMEMAYMVDPETGDRLNEGIRIKPGLVAPFSQVANNEALKEIRKEAKDINEDRDYLNRLNRSTENIIKLASQLEKEGFGTQFWKNFTLKKEPKLLAKFGPTITLDGRKVNAGVALAQEIEAVVDGYRNLKNIRGFGDRVVKHVENILASPIGSFQSPQDTIDQAINFRRMARDALLQKANNSGFISEYLEKDFVNEDRDIYSSLNKKEQSKRVDELKRDMLKSEMQYGK